MPSAIDALSGEEKTLLSERAALSWRNSAKEKSFAAPITFCSPPVSARGRASRVGLGLLASGSVLLEQAATRASVATQNCGKMRVNMCMGVKGFNSFVQHNPRGASAVTF